MHQGVMGTWCGLTGHRRKVAFEVYAGGIVAITTMKTPAKILVG